MSNLPTYLPDSRAALTLLISLVVLQLGVYALPLIKYCRSHPGKAAIHGLQDRAITVLSISPVLLGCGSTYLGYYQGSRTIQ